MKKQFLEAGKIVGTHGLKGEMRIDPWCDSPEFLCRLKRLYLSDGTEWKISSAKVHKNIAIIQFSHIKDVEEASLQRGKIVFMNREDVSLPKGRYFIQDLIGLEVVDADNGTVYGTITEVLKTGANDVYQVTKDQKDYYVPVIANVVIEKDIDGGVVKIRPMKGIFDDED